MFSIRPFQILLSLCFRLVLVRADADARCYLPNGAYASGFLPCDPTAYITGCCPTGWTCYSNGMCVVTDPSTANSSLPIGTSMRGSCTNPRWNSAVCGDFCLSDGVLDGALKACGNDKFCCASDSSCSCSSGAFQVNPGRVQTVIGISNLDHTTTSALTSSTSPPQSATSTTLKTSTTPSTTNTATSAGGGTPTPSAEPVSKKTKPKPGTIAGIVIGALLGTLLLLTACFLLYTRFFRAHSSRPSSPTPNPLPKFSPDPYDPGSPAASPGALGSPVPVASFLSAASQRNSVLAYEPQRSDVGSTTTVGTGTRGVTPEPRGGIGVVAGWDPYSNNPNNPTRAHGGN